ncbi:efflux RND transporter periplasmic adaptor subunit [Helicobacter trogontum]|nr:efflux RND transporter periplasmic adaptor subunit [Helicobacter trogontum]
MQKSMQLYIGLFYAFYMQTWNKIIKANIIKIHHSFLFVAICMIMFALMIIGCKDSTQQTQEEATLEVQAKSIVSQNVALNFEYPARLKSIQSVDVYARVQGILLTQNFNEGDIVKEGQLLFKIDPVRYQAKVNQAKAQYHSAEANFVRANRDWKRVESLYKQGVYTIDQYDTSRANYLQAQANLASTKAALEDAQIDLGYTKVMAGINGRIGMRKHDVGNLVGQSGQDVLTTITQLSPIYAEFSIPNRDYYFMRGLEDSSIQVEFVLGNGKTYNKMGKLDFIDSVLDSQTATVKARAIIDNNEYKLVPNEFVRVRLKGFEVQNAIAIPQTSLLQDKEGSYVFVAKDNKAQVARVTLGQNLPNNEVLILDGLSNGDILITNQLPKIHANTPVTPILQNSGNSKSADLMKHSMESNQADATHKKEI